MPRIRELFRRSRRNPGLLILGLSSTLLLVGAPDVHAQIGGPPTTPVHDPSALRPPAGARVAIVEFEDQECPDCAAANPLLKQAAEKYNIPWVRHDFPLPFHNWSFQAAVYARWFDTKSKKLGDDYRDSVFSNQRSIETPAQLTQFTENFAQSHGAALPFAVDPQGKLSGEVKADYALGQRIGIEHTPTIWIVTNGANGAPPYTEVVDRSHLFQMIDQALAETRGR
ncbi:MAG TPA: thioredoxin domain-containing protein [Terracidiphilus sp.]|nr:thioredoxin domain-containing protein [Terracidiphilus sp.]